MSKRSWKDSLTEVFPKHGNVENNVSHDDDDDDDEDEAVNLVIAQLSQLSEVLDAPGLCSRAAHESDQFKNNNKLSLFRIVEQYAKFLMLKAKLKDVNSRLLAAPSDALDTIWRLHILDTRRYAATCTFLGVSMIHYAPEIHLDAEERRRRQDNARIYFQVVFGEAPDVTLWGTTTNHADVESRSESMSSKRRKISDNGSTVSGRRNSIDTVRPAPFPVHSMEDPIKPPSMSVRFNFTYNHTNCSCGKEIPPNPHVDVRIPTLLYDGLYWSDDCDENVAHNDDVSNAAIRIKAKEASDRMIDHFRRVVHAQTRRSSFASRVFENNDTILFRDRLPTRMEIPDVGCYRNTASILVVSAVNQESFGIDCRVGFPIGRDCKRKIKKKLGMPVEMQRLLISKNGSAQVLEDDKCLEDYGIFSIQVVTDDNDDATVMDSPIVTLEMNE